MVFIYLLADSATPIEDIQRRDELPLVGRQRVNRALPSATTGEIYGHF